MGLKPGMTNNKNGRPPGSQNKISSELRIKITGFLDTNFDVIVKDFEKLTWSQSCFFSINPQIINFKISSEPN